MSQSADVWYQAEAILEPPGTVTWTCYHRHRKDQRAAVCARRWVKHFQAHRPAVATYCDGQRLGSEFVGQP